jgi:uncharacterized protein YjeT (DUF2065 family)
VELNWTDLLNAIALLLILEGLMPFISPSGMKETYKKLLEVSDKSLRIGGLIGILFGLLMMYLI